MEEGSEEGKREGEGEEDKGEEEGGEVSEEEGEEVATEALTDGVRLFWRITFRGSDWGWEEPTEGGSGLLIGEIDGGVRCRS